MQTVAISVRNKEFSWLVNNVKEHIEKRRVSKDTIVECRYMVPFEIREDTDRWEADKFWEKKEQVRLMMSGPASLAVISFIKN